MFMTSDSEAKISPFGTGSNWNLNACVGTNGGPYNYADYASGYLGVANSTAKRLIESKGLEDVFLDIAIYPLLYLYRQGLELIMKHFIYDRHNPPKNEVEHDLKKLWGKSKIEMEYILEPILGKEKLREALEKLAIFILSMHELDPRGQVMRFPEDPFGNLFLQDYSIINIEPIYTGGKEVEMIFDYFRNAIAEVGED